MIGFLNDKSKAQSLINKNELCQTNLLTKIKSDRNMEKAL